MVRHDAFDKHPRAEAVGMPHRCDGVGHALRQTFAPVKDDRFRSLLDELDRQTLSPGRGD